MKGNKISKELAGDLYDHRDDPDEWDGEAIEVVQRPARSEVVSLRFPAEEYRALKAAAVAAEESVSDYIRGAVKQRQEGAGIAMVQGNSPGPHVGIVYAVQSGETALSLARNLAPVPISPKDTLWHVVSTAMTP